jgi:hypothetical protein
MARKIAPSTRKAQEVSQWLEGQCEVKSGSVEGVAPAWAALQPRGARL